MRNTTKIASINLDIRKNNTIDNDPIILRQGESDVIIEATILNGGDETLQINFATFVAKKPDGTIVSNDPTNVNGSVISYSVSKHLTESVGKIQDAYFVINNEVTTCGFDISVIPSTQLDESSVNYIPGLENINKFLKDTETDWLGRIQQMKSQIAGLDIPAEFKLLMNKSLDEAKAQYQPIIDAAEENVESIAADLAAKKLDLQNNSDELNTTITAIKAQIAPVNSFLDGVQKQIIAANASFTADQQAKVSQSISNLKTRLDALGVLDIGGRNYLLDSENYNENYWLRNVGIFGDVLNDSFNGTKIAQTNVNWGGPKYSVDNLKERGLLDDTSQSWTFSAYARTTTNVTAEINFFGLDSVIEAGTVGQNWKRISVTFKLLNPNSTISFSPIDLDKVPATVQFSGYKLEKGNVATDWTPAPEDIVMSGKTITATDDTGKTVNLKITGIS
ncbi:hypothetical protein [Companilactobacillus alimentarius]|uniref:hypothetical protein n=1 Tax=Companilactobacillus alimentarius TaxID=1602 RepID=UPI0028B8E508|nr:hypothetical protein [Companilactobacillus alimentarius]MDT6953230.1 hypothetical protein [Companilactobacillus alimentarius]